MDELALFFSTKGRIDQKTFAWCILAVYLLGFFSQTLLAGNVLARAGVVPFALAQVALIWAWLVLHIKRLRDANQGPAGAIGVAIVYALAIGLVVLIVAVFTSATPPRADGQPPSAAESLMALFLVIFLFNMLFTPDFGTFATLLKILVLIACLPPLISLVFSLTTGLRKSVPSGFAGPLPPAAGPPPPQPPPSTTP